MTAAIYTSYTITPDDLGEHATAQIEVPILGCYDAIEASRHPDHPDWIPAGYDVVEYLEGLMRVNILYVPPV